MATRALIGYLNDDNTITTTYNHYDGYPENLGVALNKHYNTDAKAKEIANMGYISYVSPENGDIEAKHNDPPVLVGDNDLVSSLQYFKDEADGTDYSYLWVPVIGDWIYSPTAVKMQNFVDRFMLDIDFQDEDDLADMDSIDSMEEGYTTKWKKFINEDMPSIESKLMKLQNALEREPAEYVEMYLASVERDLKRGNKEEYENMTIEDMIEDYNVYIDDRMDS